MKKTIHFCVLLLLVAVACGKASVEGPEENFNFDDGSGVTHGMIELGDKQHFHNANFGEHIAETEIMLNEIAGAYESHTEGKRLRQADDGSYLNG